MARRLRFTASYDAILRRDSQTTAFGGTTTYLHDQKEVAQSSTTDAPSNPINNYLAMPGTGEVLAFASTIGGTTNTYVPIQDGAGSTIGLVNSANVLQTQFTYSPWGNFTTSGTASQYPYLFKGMEYDTTGLYNAGSVYYSPALGRPLQQVSPGGSGGSGGGGINASVGSSKGSGGGLSATDGAAQASGVVAAGAAAYIGAGAIIGAGIDSYAAGLIVAAGAGPVAWVVAGVAAAILGILDLFGLDFFGGGSAPVLPPGYYRRAHYILSDFLGVTYQPVV